MSNTILLGFTFLYGFICFSLMYVASKINFESSIMKNIVLVCATSVVLIVAISWLLAVAKISKKASE